VWRKVARRGAVQEFFGVVRVYIEFWVHFSADSIVRDGSRLDRLSLWSVCSFGK
jgi:hypothetical protein